jgi:hypothetical protein
MNFKIINLSLVFSSMLFGSTFNPYGVLPNAVKSIDNGGTKPAIDAYKDGIGAELIDKPGVATDNSAMNTLALKYGEDAKINNTTILNQVVNGNSNPTAADLALANKLNANGTFCNDNIDSTYNDMYMNGVCSGTLTKSCKELKVLIPSSADGIYNISLDNTEASYPVYCDMTTDGGGWTLIFKHNINGGYYSNATARSFNVMSPTSNLYSILDKLENFRKDGIFTLKINWPLNKSIYNIWSQTSNFTSQPVAGYTPINIQATENLWGGLEYNGGITFADGTVNHVNWYYSIGSTGAWNNAIPSNNSAVTEVDLWVK